MSKKRRAWAVSVVFGWTLSLLAGPIISVCAQQPPLPDYAPRPIVIDVVIKGNEGATEQFIMSQLRTRTSRDFDSTVVQADVRRLAATGRFRDVRTFTQETPRGVIVTFEVFERPTIRHIRYIGNRGISDKALDKKVGIQIGDPLNRFSVEEARRKIEDFYREKGYAQTQVSIMEGNQPQDKGAVFVINESAMERLASVNFVGNTIASSARLETQIQSKPGIFFGYGLFRGKVNRQTIEEDIDRLTAYYRNLGYFNARIGRELEYDQEGQWLTLTFVIDEGPRYVVRNVSIVGAEKFAVNDLHSKLQLASGDYFNLGAMNRDVNSLRDIYGGHGYIFANVKADPRFLEEPGQLDLVYNVQEGGVWRAGKINVHIAGEYPHTQQSVVLNRLSIRPGEIIDMREVRASERRLKFSQLFENDPARGDEPRVVIRPPEEQAVEIIAEGDRPAPTYRGQSPDDQPPPTQRWSPWPGPRAPGWPNR